MYARAVDDPRREEWEGLGLAALALALAVAGTQVRPSLAVPLFLGAVAAGTLGVQALWRRWDPVVRLDGENDAYMISELAFELDDGELPPEQLRQLLITALSAPERDRASRSPRPAVRR
jgi:hypothetical protein